MSMETPDPKAAESAPAFVPPAKEDLDIVADLGKDVVEVLAMDKVPENPALKETVRKVVEKREMRLFHDLVYALCQLDLPEPLAQQRWEEILKHKYLISERIGRNVGIHVAALDYFQNITREVKSVTMMDVYRYHQTQQDAVSDWLTGIYLKNYFYTLMEKEILRARRLDERFSIFFFDIDHFKVYNDTHGHLAGDALLKELVEVVSSLIRQYDIFARYGGEEFIVLFPSTYKPSAAGIAGEIRQTVEDYPFPGEMVLPDKTLTISGGVAEFPADGTDPAALIDAADKALYRSKESGRNRVTVC